MNLEDIKALAFDITEDDLRDTIGIRDLYYDTKKQIFMHKPVRNKYNRSAKTIINGQAKWITMSSKCSYIGRYESEVNPNWILEDMLNVL